MTRLRICLIASCRFPLREPFMGGLEAQTHTLAHGLRRRGHDVSVFAAPGSDTGLGVTALPVAGFRSSEAARADVASPPEQWMEEHHAYLELMLGLADGSRGRYDVVHNNSLHHLPVAMARLLDTPVLTTLHTPPLAWLESAALLASPGAHFVAVSDHVARAWRHCVAAETVHNGIDTRRWSAGPGGNGAVWTGRIVPEKAPHDALDAARLAGVPIVLAGPVHDRDYFDREVVPRLGGSARYLGHLDGTALRRAVGAATVAVVTPRWDEPFGLVAAEAMSCGTPVAGYDRGALAEVLGTDGGALAPAGDVAALADAMLRAGRLDRRAVRMRARSHFGVGRMIDSYEAVYRRLSVRLGAA